MRLILLLASFGGIEGFGFKSYNSARYLAQNQIDRNRGDQISETCMGRLPFYLLSSEVGDASEIVGEDLTYLNEEFSRLANGRTLISFQDFLGSEAIQAILSDEESDEYLSDIREIWTLQAKSLDTSIDLPLFISINREVDDLFEYVDDEDDEDSSIELNDEEKEIKRLSDIIEGRNNNTEEEFEGGEVIEVKDVDIWDPFFDVKEYFGLDFLKYLKKFYDENLDENKGLLSFSSFCQWADIKQMLIDGELDETCLSELWSEATLERNKRRPSTGEEKIPNKGFKVESDDVRNGFIDFDTFTRMNVRLDVVLDEIKDALGNLTDSEVEQYYLEEFAKISEGEELISYNQLLGWTDLKQLIEGGDVTMTQFDEMWEALPKRPLGTFVKKQNSKKAQQSDGISSEAFLAFNTALEDLDSDTSSGALD